MSDTSRAAIESELPTVAEALTTPLPRECLLCYVWRMLEDFGCDATLRWARHWRDARAPRATALEHRLGQHGGFCDCEIFLNGWVLLSTLQRYDDDGALEISAGPSAECRGVRSGSAQPCALWVRRPRG